MYTISSLIPFDMLFDVDFGILKVIQFNAEYKEKLITPENETFFNMTGVEYADTISKMLIERSMSSPLSVIMPTEEVIKNAAICDEILERYPLEVYKLARKTAICDMVSLGLADDSDTLKFTILCDNKAEQEILTQRFALMGKKVQSILKNELTSYDAYGSIYIKNIFNIDDSIPIEGKNILIANCRYNMDEDGKMPNAVAISPYIQLNKIHTIDLYDMNRLLEKEKENNEKKHFKQ